MDDKFHQLMDAIILEYTKDDWLTIIKLLKKHIQRGEKDIIVFRKSLETNGVSCDFIERECAWRMWLNGLIPREEAKKRMLAIDERLQRTQ